MSLPAVPDFRTANSAAVVDAMLREYIALISHAIAAERAKRGHNNYRGVKRDGDAAISQAQVAARARKNQLAAAPAPIAGGAPGRMIPGPGPTDLPGPFSVITTPGSGQQFIPDPTPPAPAPLTGAPAPGPVLPPTPAGETAQYTERRPPTPPDAAAEAARRELLTQDAGRPLPGLAALGGVRAATATGVQRAPLQAIHRPISRPAVGRSTFAGGAYYATNRPAPPVVQPQPRSLIDAILELFR